MVIAAGMGMCGGRVAAGDTPDAVPRRPAVPDTAQITPADTLTRVLLLTPPRPLSPTPQIQWHLAQERAARSKTRRKSRRRPPASQSTLPLLNGSSVGANGGKASPSHASAAAPSPTAPTEGKTLAAPIEGKMDVVPLEQRVPLAQALFVDVLAARLQDRLGVSVAGENEVSDALKALHLTPEQAMQPANARLLCVRLHCGAALMPRVTACTVREDGTRDAMVFAQVRIVTNGSAATPMLRKPSAKSTLPAEGAPMPADWPMQMETAGTSSSDRVLFHKQYKQPQGDVIRDATQQAVNLLLHALRTGQEAPFLRAEDRIAVTPTLLPSGADKLVFTPKGRRVEPVLLEPFAVSLLPLFLPDLMPVAPERIVGETEVREALSAQQSAPALLWKGEDQPARERVQALGRRLRADYVLQARITDVQLSESAPETHASADIPASEQTHAARVEATAALTRIGDGALLWHDRVTATMAASPATVGSRAPQTNQTLIRDATHFALVELQRRLRRYRNTFEK